MLVIGGSGSGKTRFWLKPNLMQMHSSYVVTDPKGTILAARQGRQGTSTALKVLNTINFNKSMHYNPFSYIHSEKDILKLVTTLIANTKGEGKADDFWVKAETLFTGAHRLHPLRGPGGGTELLTLIEFINASEVREDDEEFKNQVDLLFDELEAEAPTTLR